MTYRNASWLAIILAMSLGKQAFALSATSAPPARGDPPITEGAGGGIGTGGGADLPGGITDAPPPETPNTDGSWTATVGGTEFAGLTEADVGRVLWRGERVNVTYEDADGLVQTASVCEGFPELTVTGTTRPDGLVVDEIVVDMDPVACAFVLADVRRDAAAASTSWQFANPTWTGVKIARAFPTSWIEVPAIGNSGYESDAQLIPRWATDLNAKVRALDFVGLTLTSLRVSTEYEPDSLTPTFYRTECHAARPAGILGVRWHRDACLGDQEIRTNHVYSWGEGQFHGESDLDGWWHLEGESRHTITGRIRSYRDREDYDCRISPRSFEDTHVLTNWIWPLEELGLGFGCRVQQSGYGR